MTTMNVSLPQSLADYVELEVKSGDYGTASEVVREALRLLRRERSAGEERLAILRGAVAVGLEDASAGRFSDRSIREIAESIARE